VPADLTREPPGFTTQVADAVLRRFLESPLADAFIDRVIQALMRSGELERLITQAVADLEASPVVDSLVDRQIARVLEALRESEALRLLIQKQAGDYLEHLGEHPEPVQRLIREQSRGVVEEFLESLRERALAGDDIVDRWVRRATGRA
jgi:hypothetical protein